MRTIRVRNASILAKINGTKIDVEIRTTKDSGRGIALYIDGQKILEIDYKGEGKGIHAFVDNPFSLKGRKCALFTLASKSLTQILAELDWKEILREAIQLRSSSWADRAVVEYRNAGDTIYCALLMELRKRGYVR